MDVVDARTGGGCGDTEGMGDRVEGAARVCERVGCETCCREDEGVGPVDEPVELDFRDAAEREGPRRAATLAERD